MFQKIINKLNDMRPRQLMLLAVAAAALMFMSIVAVINMMSKEKVVVQEETPPPAVEEKIAVVVAKQNIHPRTRIQETMLQMKELPVDMVPEGAIKSFDDVKNVQLKVSIFAGDVLTIQKVFAESSDEGFTGNIPADCRAVSINVNDVTSVAGFAKPGDRVDLLLVEKGKYSATTNILLQNVPLLSINQDVGQTPVVGENGVPAAAITNPSIATFALRPEDALKLISASKLGEIYLSLRPSKPQSAYVEPMEYTMESVDAPKEQPQPAPVPAIPAAAPLPQIPSIPAAPTTPRIEIIAGDQIVQTTNPALMPSVPTQSQQQLPAIPSPQQPSPPVVSQ